MIVKCIPWHFRDKAIKMDVGGDVSGMWTHGNRVYSRYGS